MTCKTVRLEILRHAVHATIARASTDSVQDGVVTIGGHPYGGIGRAFHDSYADKLRRDATLVSRGDTLREEGLSWASPSVHTIDVPEYQWTRLLARYATHEALWAAWGVYQRTANGEAAYLARCAAVQKGQPTASFDAEAMAWADNGGFDLHQRLVDTGGWYSASHGWMVNKGNRRDSAITLGYDITEAMVASAEAATCRPRAA